MLILSVVLVFINYGMLVQPFKSYEATETCILNNVIFCMCQALYFKCFVGDNVLDRSVRPASHVVHLDALGFVHWQVRMVRYHRHCRHSERRKSLRLHQMSLAKT